MPTNASPQKLQDMLRKVQAMMTRADHPNTPTAEAETARNMAEALMYKYRIDEASLGNTAGSDSLMPGWGTFTVCSSQSEYSSHYRSIAGAVLQHLDCRGVFRTEQVFAEDGSSSYMVVAHFAGFDTDRRIAEALFTSCQVAFQVKLEPKYDPELSDEVNAYRMRMAGMEGWRIAEAVLGDGKKANRPKVRKMFEREALRRGEDPSILLGKGNSVKAYREDYATGFANEIHYRLSAMRRSRGESGTGLVLADRKPKVNECFYEKYPAYRPADSNAGPYRSANHGCAKCAKAKSGYCREHGWLKPRAARATRNANMAAYDRGRSAARTVDLGPGGTSKVQAKPADPELGR